MTGEIAIKEIHEKREGIIGLSKKIWGAAETAYQEVKSAEWIAEYLEAEGFRVERCYTGVPTAIMATWGEGKPVVGFLGEYDALDGLSQKAAPVKEPVVPGGSGQGCGHNLIGAACVAAVVGAKREMEEKGLKGTLVFYGCPAEEVLTGKVFMARGGAFRELDLSFAYHPGSSYGYMTGRVTAMNSARFHFKGRTAHAGADPQNGRSALDAAELMSSGANYLREHVTSDVRIHYAYTEVNSAPNVVPEKTTVWYFVRAFSRAAVEDTYERLIKVAKGAAMMTETEVDVEFLGGCYNTLQNKVVVDLVRKTSMELGPIKWSEEDCAFAKTLDGQSKIDQSLMGEELQKGSYLDTNVDAPIVSFDAYGSTDVGDVQHIAPGAFFMVPSASLSAGSHTWQVTACSGMDIGMKGMLRGGEIMALCALKAIEDPSIIEAAKAEFKEAMKGKEYVCPIGDIVPVPAPHAE